MTMTGAPSLGFDVPASWCSIAFVSVADTHLPEAQPIGHDRGGMAAIGLTVGAAGAAEEHAPTGRESTSSSGSRTADVTPGVVWSEHQLS